MPSLKDIRSRIGSVKNTKKITSAMKLVAASKLSKAEERVEASRPYAAKMQRVIGGLAERADTSSHPLLERAEVPDSMIIVIVSSDRGLCGAFNTNLFRAIDRFIDERDERYSTIDVATVGTKALQYYRREGAEIHKNYKDIIGDVTLQSAKWIARDMMDMFTRGEYDEVYIAFNEYISAINYNTLVEKLLPLEAVDSGEEGEEEAESSGGEELDIASEYIYEPSADELLERLLPSNVEIQVLQALLESGAAEQGSRMVAMDNATSNAEDLIESLTLQYNRARQAYITKELVEIVSGAEALKG
jgi:F-type H+-transporting ATPase subunit gamma